MSSQSFSCFVFCFPVSHRSDLPPVLPQRTPFISSPGTTSTRANRMPSCKAGCVFGCWQLTGCRGTLLSPIWPFWVQMRCCGVREPPAESAEIPEAPPSVDGVTEPLGPLSRHPAANTQLRFRRCTSPRRYCIAFPFIGTPSLFDFFSAARCGCFCLQTTSSPLQDEQLQALLLQFFGTVHCRWDGVEELCSFQGMAWRPTGAAHCIKAASILHHAVFTEPPMGARLQQALGQRVRGWMSTTQSRSRRCGRVGVLIEATSDASDPGEALHAITPTWEAVPVC